MGGVGHLQTWMSSGACEREWVWAAASRWARATTVWVWAAAGAGGAWADTGRVPGVVVGVRPAGDCAVESGYGLGGQLRIRANASMGACSGKHAALSTGLLNGHGAKAWGGACARIGTRARWRKCTQERAGVARGRGPGNVSESSGFQVLRRGGDITKGRDMVQGEEDD
ncbi:hypothetical protein FIBSPDRAFT_893607 [Athelia psychrophila]|uniref:Uncharacterized protein n=1 Tax=Athelia psychrophila TaxID=1759441 RepID=A0A166GX97_9AGAM|nr:hypothetical protein FIBSPDRAFT_893607 [Fibularhizoctonia sp. CBS 109695]